MATTRCTYSNATGSVINFGGFVVDTGETVVTPNNRSANDALIPGGGRQDSRYEREVEQKYIMVLFCDLILLRQGHYIQYTNPSGVVRTFLVDSFRDDQDLGKLWVAECTEIPDPTEGQ